MTRVVNPLVDYLNSLRTQGGSDPNYVEENRSDYLERLRAQHPWFPTEAQLRVKTRISALVDAMRRPDFPVDLVILTGDAGDGKTAACVDLARDSGLQRSLLPIDAAGPWTIVKDASENPEADLVEALAATRAGRTRLVVAINEGRLRRLRSVATLADVWADVIEPALASWIDEAAAARLDEGMRRHRVAVVNFRHRMHVRTVAPALFETWTNPGWWEDGGACAACPAKDRCAILANAQSLRDPVVVGRMTDVVAMAHFSGQRLPFRRLQGLLAFSTTGGLTCGAIISGRPPQLADRYYSLLFQREARGDARPEPIGRVLAPADAGTTVDPVVDARIAGWLRHDSDAALPRFDIAAFSGSTETENTRALRRYDALAKTGSASATWRKALALLEGFAAEGREEPLRNAVVRGLNALHRVDAAMVSAITAQQMEPAAFRDPARASLELSLGTEFEVHLTRGPVLPDLVSAWLESCPSDIDLVAWPRRTPRPHAPARLRLDARLVALLLDVDEGYRFLPALGTYRRELARFHAHLLSLVQPEAVAVTLRSGSRSWKVTAAGDKLRLDARD